MGSHHKEHIFEGAVELKYCGKCGLYLPLINFSKSSSSWDKLITSCKVCDKKYYNVNSIHIRELAKEDYKKNKDKNLLRNKERRESTDYNKNYYKKNKKRILDYSKKYYKENIQIFKQRYQDNKEYYNERNRKYYKERLEKNRIAHKKLYENITHRLSSCISSAMLKSLKGRKNWVHWEFLVGYNLATLIAHLESLFEPWMNWTNYGNRPGCWVIDHIKPIIAFHFTSYEDQEFQECWALSNLRPLSWEENNKKSSFYEGIRLRRKKNEKI